jgi:molecular chaperone DnaJ
LSSKADYYQVLGVSRDATDQDLKQAYRRLAIKFHPDKNPGDKAAEERFKEIAEAYQVLSSVEMRARYDRYGHAGVGATAGAGSPFGAGQGFPGFEDILSDLFGLGDVFGSRGRRQGPRSGSDLRYDIEISLEEAAAGLKTKIRIPRLETCGGCDGTGAAEGSAPVRCQTCGGSGQVRYQQGFFSVGRTCSTCRGVGKIIRDACKECRGAGRVERDKSLEIRVPAGIETGSRLRISGEGEAGEPGAARGDLYVIVHVREHEFFDRKDSNLYCTQSVSFTQVALGAEISVRTLDGPETLKIPEGTQTGSVFRLKNRGMPELGGRGRGDLFVSINVLTPKHLSREQRKLLEQFEQMESGPAEHTERKIINKVKDMFG